MSLELINKHAAKIILAIEPGDSINQISRKTGSSYGWTHKWIKKLEESDVIEDKEGWRVRDEEVAEQYEGLAQSVFSRDMDLEEAYLLPNFSGMEYRFSKIDAVYIWTKGGYQITRSKDDYPIFIDILEEDIEDWKNYLENFSIDYTIENRKENTDGIYYILDPQQEIESTWLENAPVTPLDETVDYAMEYRYNFEPALEMLDEMYDLGLDVEYSERKAL